MGALNASLIAAGKISRITELWESISPKRVLSFSQNIFGRGALFNNSPLENLVREEIDKKSAKKIIDSSIKLIVISCDLKSKREIVNKDFKDYEQIIHSLMSSCSIPIIFPSHKLSGGLKKNEIANPLVDGGFVNNFPLNEAIKSGLCKTFFTVSLNVPETESSESKSIFHTGMRVLETIFTASYLSEINGIREKIRLANVLKELLKTKIFPPNLLSKKRTKKIKKLYDEYKNYEGLNIIEINPKEKLPIGVLDFPSDKAKKAISMGYKDAKEILKGIKII